MSYVPAHKSTKDIFALRLDRIIGPYRKISINNLEIAVNGKPRHSVNGRIYPLNTQFSELRFWSDKELIDVKKIKNSDLKAVHF